MSMFSRRHYIFLTESLTKALDAAPYATDREIIKTLIESLADDLLRESPRGFDRDLFIQNIKTTPKMSLNPTEDEKCPTP